MRSNIHLKRYSMCFLTAVFLLSFQKELRCEAPALPYMPFDIDKESDAKEDSSSDKTPSKQKDTWKKKSNTPSSGGSGNSAALEGAQKKAAMDFVEKLPHGRNGVDYMNMVYTSGERSLASKGSSRNVNDYFQIFAKAWLTKDSTTATAWIKQSKLPQAMKDDLIKNKGSESGPSHTWSDPGF
jgi:hypothetical protein